MGVSVVPIIVFTVLWGVVGIVCPFFAPKGPNRGIIQVVLMLTAATCWLFWLCAYMAQMNPLIGPRLNNETLIWISRQWVLTALFFFASGSYQRPVGVAKNVSQKTCSYYIEEVTKALIHRGMLNKYIRFPDSRTARQRISHRVTRSPTPPMPGKQQLAQGTGNQLALSS